MSRFFELSLEPSLKQVTEPHVNLRVPALVYDVEGGAIFAKNSTFVFFNGFAWTPRLQSPSPPPTQLWFLLEPIVQHCTRAALTGLITAENFPALS